MNDHPHNSMEPGVPADLLGVSSSLDRLGASDRDAAGAFFEARLAAATLPGAALDERRLHALAGADRAAAAPTLEDRIFLATRALLPAPGSQADAPEPVRIHVRSSTRFLRVAASMAIVAGAGLLSYVSMGPSGAGRTLAARTSTDSIATQLEDDFAGLASVLSVALGSAESDTASSTTIETSYETGEIEFPRFDLLTSDTEGSL
jgi:hypothetical protein